MLGVGIFCTGIALLILIPFIIYLHDEFSDCCIGGKRWKHVQPGLKGWRKCMKIDMDRWYDGELTIWRKHYGGGLRDPWEVHMVVKDNHKLLHLRGMYMHGSYWCCAWDEWKSKLPAGTYTWEKMNHDIVELVRQHVDNTPKKLEAWIGEYCEIDNPEYNYRADAIAKTFCWLRDLRLGPAPRFFEYNLFLDKEVPVSEN